VALGQKLYALHIILKETVRMFDTFFRTKDLQPLNSFSDKCGMCCGSICQSGSSWCLADFHTFPIRCQQQQKKNKHE